MSLNGYGVVGTVCRLLMYSNRVPTAAAVRAVLKVEITVL